jgi:hypothetical protein
MKVSHIKTFETCYACASITTIRRDADKSLAFPISPTFILLILSSYHCFLFCMCLTYIS